MMTLRTSITLACLLVYCQPSAASQWLKLSDNVLSRLWIDKQSVIAQLPYHKAWVKVDYKTPQKNTESVEEKNYNASKALWYFDCSTQKYATTQVYQYDHQALIYSAGAEVKNVEFIEPVPESDVEIAMRYVCQKNQSKPAESPAQTPAPAKTSAPTDNKATDTGKPVEKDPNNKEPSAEKRTESKPSAPTTEKSSPEKKTPTVANPKNKADNTWGYQDKTGPNFWGQINPEYGICSQGKNQSPIHIETTLHAALKPIRSIQKFAAKDIKNTGKGIEINFRDGNMMVLDKAPFQLKKLALHSPSEHKVNGKQYPIEAQYIHADKEGNTTIVAVFIKEGESNAALENLLPQIPAVGENSTPLKGRLTPANLMPTNPQYYRLTGSLTTPPCTEGVRWVIMKTPLTATKSQIEQLQNAIGAANNRPTQPTYARVVLE